jgi:hypothetical protein
MQLNSFTATNWSCYRPEASRNVHSELPIHHLMPWPSYKNNLPAYLMTTKNIVNHDPKKMEKVWISGDQKSCWI